MITVYVLQSLKDGRNYVGMTDKLKERIKRHNQGKVPSTRNRRPLALLYTEELDDRLSARKREKYFKSGPGHRELQSILAGRRVPTSSG
jgi:putative endonuclease